MIPFINLSALLFPHIWRVLTGRGQSLSLISETYKVWTPLETVHPFVLNVIFCQLNSSYAEPD